MAKIVVAPHAGFCFGVKRAINIAERISREDKGKRIWSIGPLIHNPQEVERLRKKGIEVLETEDKLNVGDTVIIRSHGIPPDKEKEYIEKGLKIVDATCPYVKAVHQAVERLVEEGYFVVLLGERNHPEVIGTLGYLKKAGGSGIVVETKEDLEKVKHIERIGVVAQTTQNEQFFKEAVGELALWAKEIKVINTICNATSERQEDVYELAPKVDVMIIVGGKNSGNTRRLYEISRSLNPRSYHVETAQELEESWFDGAETVGITAGASTPDWIIEEVKKRVEGILK
ncbi:4-hydroxy-3-methylbut-2-enyl diphosphate reductase [Thermocrinis sp.]